MRYYIIAGEASGDLHGSNLIRALKKRDGELLVRCWGGELMEKAGAELVKDYRELAFMGFIEVARNLRTIFKNLEFCKEDILRFKPDALILIDYPGFNLRIAGWAKTQGLKVIYYISPQVWAWKENRVKKIKTSVDLMLVILPFEKAFYKKWDYQVEYVGHPLVEVVDAYKAGISGPRPNGIGNGSNFPIIALLPGSRKQEIQIKLPLMLSVSGFFPEYQFVVAQAPGQDDALYQDLCRDYPKVSTVKNNTYSLLLRAKAACVTSGTATLETALFGVPEVVCYKGSIISYQIAKRLIKVRYISLVNLIMDKPVVKELIQDDLTTKNLRDALDEILTNNQTREKLANDYADLKSLLNLGGDASANAANAITEFLRPNVF